jgi:prepilin-type N-terminal cleavage/methylation domain-containing protein/prepilin-type processing-associated H-X9-DG protein
MNIPVPAFGGGAAVRGPFPRAFTLVELLVVIGIIALLVGLLLPALSKARRESQRAACLANIRSFQIAQTNYAADNKGYLVAPGLSHGVTDDHHGHGDEDDDHHEGHEEAAWFNTLQKYYANRLLARCPSDDSPHWPGGTPIGGRYRVTSYGVNPFLGGTMTPYGPTYIKITQVRRPSTTIQFMEMAETGPFAVADHADIEEWSEHPMEHAPEHLQLHRHGGRARTWGAVANYSFLDGHAESLPFSEVYTDAKKNKFDPAVAR